MSFQTMENDVKMRVRANVTFYKNDDVDIRIPQENVALKLEKVIDSKYFRLIWIKGNQTIQKIP